MSQIVELTSLQQEEPPCCICYVQKNTKSIIEYRCVRCNEGIVCMECAGKLWTSYGRNKCPICMYSPDSPDTWYQPHDVEMGDIFPPSIEYVQESEYNNHNWPIMQWMAEFVCGILASGALGTFIKVVMNICYWDCSYEPYIITVLTSIGIGVIVFPVLIIVGIGIVCILTMLLECIVWTSEKVCEYINNYYENDQYPLHIICKRNIKNGIVWTAYFAITLVVSFLSGTLFKMSNDKCYWDCENEIQQYTILSSIMIGAFMLLLISLLALITVSIIAMLFICIASIYCSGLD